MNDGYRPVGSGSLRPQPPTSPTALPGPATSLSLWQVRAGEGQTIDVKIRVDRTPKDIVADIVKRQREKDSLRSRRKGGVLLGNDPYDLEMQVRDLERVSGDLRHLYKNIMARPDSPERRHDEGLLSRSIRNLENIINHRRR